MTKLRKLDIVLRVTEVVMILWFGLAGISQGLTGEPLGATAAILGLHWFGSLLKEQRKSKKLSERLLDSELETAFRDAASQGEMNANCNEINHKIDVGYYQGR